MLSSRVRSVVRAKLPSKMHWVSTSVTVPYWDLDWGSGARNKIWESPLAGEPNPAPACLKDDLRPPVPPVGRPSNRSKCHWGTGPFRRWITRDEAEPSGG